MYTLVTSDEGSGGPRLIASEPLSAADFCAIAEQIQTPPVSARKVAEVAARLSETSQQIDTRWNGKETRNIAKPNDWIVTSLAHNRGLLRDAEGNPNTYVIRSERFLELYQATTGRNEFGDFYRAISKVEAIHLAGGFEIIAPWHAVQRAASGYLLRNGNEVYGNNAETFLATYEFDR